jgi:hypothetical protein
VSSESLFHDDASADWARLDSNQGPRDYESPALTAELQAHIPNYQIVNIVAKIVS